MFVLRAATIKDVLWNKLCQELAVDQESVLFCPMRAIAQLYAQVRYDGYLEREEQDAVKLEKYMSIKLPINNDEFYRISGLSAELQQKLILHKPATIGQAMQIPGMTPAAATILAIMS